MFSPANFIKTYTRIEQKSRVPQLQGVQGRNCSMLPRAFGNAEDGVPSAFPKGIPNGEFFSKLFFIDRRYMKFRTNDKTNNYFK